MATENNMAPGQQNAPEEGKTAYRPDQADGSEIIEGAQQDDQLKSQEENARQAPFEHHIGASPSKDTLSQQDIADGVKTFEQETEPHMALETKEVKTMGLNPQLLRGKEVIIHKL
jgi:hypothetical protein